MPEYKSMRCVRCGALTQRKAGNQRYCPSCAAAMRTQAWKKQWAARRAAALEAPKRCAYCKKEFSPERERQRYCSKACSAAAYNASRRAQTRASYRVPDGIGTRKGRIPPYLNGQRAPKDNREWIIYDTYQAHKLGLSYGKYKAASAEGGKGK